MAWLNDGVHHHANRGTLRERMVVEQPVSITYCTPSSCCHGFSIVRLDEGVHPHANRSRLRGRKVVEQPLPSPAIHLVAVVRDDRSWLRHRKAPLGSSWVPC